MKYSARQSFLAALAITLITCSSLYAQSNAQGDGNGSAPTAPDVPRTISYQGLVRGTDNKPIRDGVHNFALTLYRDESATVVVWKDAYTLSTENGIFNARIGSGTLPRPEGAWLGRPLEHRILLTA